MAWTKEYLDVVLVSSVLLIMSAYHVFLLYRYLKFPQTTTIGFENHCKKAWVGRRLQVEAKDRGLALTVINSTIPGATFSAITSLNLSSLIEAWMGSSTHNIFRSKLIYGNTSSSLITIKYICILTRFLVAFGSFLQCVMSYDHANFLIGMPNADVPASYVQKAVMRGSASWATGLRATHYATTLLDLWSNTDVCCFSAYGDGSAQA